MHLPDSAIATGPGLKEASPVPGGSQPTLRVLLVEDNPGDARLIQELLREARAGRFETALASRLSEAMEKLASDHFQLILLDLSLPDSHGIETFRKMTAHAPLVPLIVLSGLDDEALALQTVEQGAQDYLVKGQVDPRILERAIRYAMKRVEAERALAEERNLLRSVIDNLLDSIYVKDAQGRYLLDNVAHRRLLGADGPEQVVGKTAFDFFPEPTAAKFQEDDAAVLRSGEPIVNREEVVVAPDSTAVRWMSMTKVPLRNRSGQCIGVIGIGRDITERKAAEEQIFRYNAEIRQRNVEFEDDLHMAREIQQAFLPQQYPTFPRGVSPAESAIRFWSRYIPTTSVGGDFFHILPISDTEAGIFICDVMGHGVRAALVTAIQRALVEEMLPASSDPGRFLTEINRALLSILRRARTPMFASAFSLVVDLARGCVRYANAGHPSPIHMRRETHEIRFLCGESERPGPALGVFKDAVYEMRTFPIEPHDTLFLFTDGLYEVEGNNDAFFSQEMLLSVLRDGMAMPTELLMDDTLGEIRDFALEHTFTDDVCLIGVEIERTGATVGQTP
ncbi:MAG: SpoIIE family protein phosphatase [Verrucomicrobia bacterium]|nr:SpoIIE family protein phosphatase [Verrucomicrobiota bacterium]